LLKRVLEVDPFDLDANSYLSIWNLVSAFEDVSLPFPNLESDFLKAARQISQSRAADLQDIVDRVKRIITSPPTRTMDSNSQAIVTLGYKLNDDGSMDDTLIRRLETTLQLAKEQGSAKLVLSGGIATNGRTESAAMTEWLISRGISSDRIVEESTARNTVENGLCSARLLADHRIRHATLVTSAAHMRRGQICLELACSPRIRIDPVCEGDPQGCRVDRDELRRLFNDALRVYGMWMFRSDPLRER
jgi:vancomycin permeability regulator SanA